MSTYRRYSDKEKAEALAAFDSCKRVTQVAAETGIPRKTLTEWIHGRHSDDVAELRPEKRENLADMLETYIRKALPVAIEKVDDANPAHLMTSVGIAIDKMRLLREESTTIAESRHESREEKLKRAAELVEKHGLKLDRIA